MKPLSRNERSDAFEDHIDTCRACFEAWEMECSNDPCQLGKKLARQYWADKNPNDHEDVDEWVVDCRPGAE